jgi:hypothetical protein
LWFSPKTNGGGFWRLWPLGKRFSQYFCRPRAPPSPRRSEQTARALEQLRLNSIPIARQTASLDETANVLFTTAQILTEDLSTWQVLYGRKRLDLRA